jgi:prolycopene isomerase
LNLTTKALEAVGHMLEVIHFHLPGDLSVLVHREYGDFIRELISKFPHEKEGILKFYGTCWKVTSCYFACASRICLCYSFITQFVTKFAKLILQSHFKQIFNSLNSLELKSLEEPLYLFVQFFQKPVECLTLGI